MIASAYHDPETIIGAISGVGCNACYMENCGSIPKLSGLPQDLPMAINCEYGAFDNEHLVLPRTKYDINIDEESPRPNEQAFEKMSAGMYVGEIFRQVLVDLYDRGLVFKKQKANHLKTPFILDDLFIHNLEEDFTSRLTKTRQVFGSLLHLQASDAELFLCRRIAALVATRRARLCTCGVSAICMKKGIETGHVAFDADVAGKPRFRARWSQALGEVLGWPDDRKEDPYVSSHTCTSFLLIPTVRNESSARMQRQPLTSSQYYHDRRTRRLRRRRRCHQRNDFATYPRWRPYWCSAEVVFWLLSYV